MDNSIEKIKNDFINSLKNDISVNYHENDDKVLTELLEFYLEKASDSSNRKITDKKLLPYVYDAVKSSFMRRGDEGKNSSSEGGISSSYLDIEKKLRIDVREIRLLS